SEENAGVDALLSHISDVCSGVVVAREDFFPFVSAQANLTSGRRFDTKGALWRFAVETPAVASIRSAQHARSAVTKFLRHARDEEIARFENVVICRNNAVIHGNPLVRRWLTQFRFDTARS